MKFKYSARLPIPADVYFVERDTDSFRELQVQMLKLGQLRIVDSMRHLDKHVVRLATKHINKYIPSPLRKKLGIEEISFEDILLYDQAMVQGPTYTVSFTTIPPMAMEKVDIEGRLMIEPIDEHSCLQTLEGNISVRLFALGSMIESIVMDFMSRTHEKLPEVVYEWMFRREIILGKEGLGGLLRGRPAMNWLPRDVDRIGKCHAYRSPFVIPQDMGPSTKPPCSTCYSDMDSGHTHATVSLSSVESGQDLGLDAGPASGFVPGNGMVVRECSSSSEYFSRNTNMCVEQVGPRRPNAEGFAIPSSRPSVKSISTRNSGMQLQQRRLARAQRNCWCGLGMPIPGPCAPGDEWLHGVEGDEVIRKCTSMEIGVELGPNMQTIYDVGRWLAANVDAVGTVVDGEASHARRKPRGKKRWSLCGFVNLDDDYASDARVQTGMTENGLKSPSSNRRKKQNSSKIMEERVQLKDCGCCAICTAPRPRDLNTSGVVT